MSMKTRSVQGVLVVTAVALAAAAFWLLGSPRADATVGDVAQAGSYTVLSTDAANEDVVIVLDGRQEDLFVYRIDPRNGIELLQKVSLPQAFTDARAKAAGRK
jgi:hypothetical protein